MCFLSFSKVRVFLGYLFLAKVVMFLLFAHSNISEMYMNCIKLFIFDVILPELNRNIK